MPPDISVVIPTRNRADSLHQTLTCLADADRTGLRAQVLVVDNGGMDNTPEVVRQFKDRLEARYLSEPQQGAYGKSHALNRALDAGNLGTIVAVLDDDMSPHAEWFQGVARLCRRWPEKDLFTGRSYVVWPETAPSAFLDSATLQKWMYSIFDEGEEDQPMGNSRWFSGNHFWFRSRCLSSGIRFEDIWLTEPKFMLDLVEMGYGAVCGADAVVGHRIQESLLNRIAIRERAAKVGRSNASVRLRPYRSTVKHARMFREHPLLGRLFCCVKLLQSCGNLAKAKLRPAEDERFVGTVIALEQIIYHTELLRTVAQMPEYQVFKGSLKAGSLRRLILS